MIENSNLSQKKINYPSDIVFKAIFRNNDSTLASLKDILNAHGVEGNIEANSSKNGKFISYTVAGKFPSQETVNSICDAITSLQDFMSLF